MLATALVAILIVAAPALGVFLHVSVGVLALLASGMAPLVIGLVPKSLLLGRQRFRPVAMGTTLDIIVKFGLGAMLALVSPGVAGALVSIAAAETATACWYLYAARGDLRRHSKELDITLRDISGPTIAIAGFWTLTIIDTVLARHYLPRTASGYYAAAATATRAVIFLPGAIVTVAFPKFSAARVDHAEKRRVLLHALVFVGVLGSAGALAMTAFPRLFVSVLFGAKFGASSGVVGLLAFRGTQSRARAGWHVLPDRRAVRRGPRSMGGSDRSGGAHLSPARQLGSHRSLHVDRRHSGAHLGMRHICDGQPRALGLQPLRMRPCGSRGQPPWM